MSDITDNMAGDQDLMDILNGSVSLDDASSNKGNSNTSGTGSQSSSTDLAEADDKLQQLKSIAQSLSVQSSTSNSGSGDLDDDLSNWFDGKDNLPSDDLSRYVSNPSIKMDYGLTRNVLSSYDMMGRLRKYLEEDAFEVLLDRNSLLSLDNSELMDRVKTVFAMYKELGNLNAKIVKDIRDYKIKSGEDDTDVDRLTLLLSSIPSEKLNKILEDISYGDTK